MEIVRVRSFALSVPLLIYLQKSYTPKILTFMLLLIHTSSWQMQIINLKLSTKTSLAQIHYCCWHKFFFCLVWVFLVRLVWVFVPVDLHQEMKMWPVFSLHFLLYVGEKRIQYIAWALAWFILLLFRNLPVPVQVVGVEKLEIRSHIPTIFFHCIINDFNFYTINCTQYVQV